MNRVAISFIGKDLLSALVRGIRNSMDGFKRDAATGFGLGAGISVFNTAQRAIGAVTDYMGDAVKMASSMSETQSKVGQVYKTSGQQVLDWGQDAATAMGMSQQAALESHATFGNFIQALGAGEEQSREMSGSLVQLAADLGSFNNTGVDEVIMALRSGLAGEAEPMRRLGADVSAARVEMELLEMGIEKVNGKFTESQKIQGRYRAIMEDTTSAQGDFARTADGLANSTKTVNAQLADLQTDLGMRFLPVVKEAMLWIRDQGIPILESMGEHFDNLGKLAFDPADWAFPEDAWMGQEEALRGLMQTLGLTEAQIMELVQANRMLLISNTDYEGNLISTEQQVQRFLTAIALQARSTEMLAGRTKQLTIEYGSQQVAQAQAAATAEELAAAEKLAADKAAKLAAQLDLVSGAALPELRESAKTNFAAFVKAIESTGNPLRALKREEEGLLTLKAEAARKEQYWNVVAINQRLEEIHLLKQAERAARDLFRTASLDPVMDIRVDTSDIDMAMNKVASFFGMMGQASKARGSVGGATAGIGGGARAGTTHKDFLDLKADVEATARALDDVGSSGGGASGGLDKAGKSAKELAQAAKEAKAEALEKMLDAIKAAADRVSEAFQNIAKTDFVDLRDSGQEAIQAIRDSLNALIDPMAVIHEEEAQLKALRAEAAAQGRVDLMATIDLRLQELAVMEEQYLQMKKRYTEESDAIDILHAKLDITKKKAQELLETYRRKSDIGDDVTDEELARIIVRIRGKRAAGGPVSAGSTYLVGERGPELLTMGGNGYVTPNNAISGGGGDVYLDGYLVGRILDERLGRQYGTASRGGYRRARRWRSR